MTASTTHLRTERPTPAGAPPARRVLRGFARRDAFDLAGAAVSAVSTTVLLFGRLTPLTGVLGAIVVAYLLFLVIYAFLLSLSEDRPTVVDKVMAVLLATAAGIALIALCSVIAFVLWRGRSVLLRPNFYVHDMSSTGPTDPLSSGGIGHAVLGTLVIITGSLVVTVPLGITCAVFLNETRSRLARPVRTIVDAMTALPSILAGLFIFATWILVLGFERSGLAASLAVSLMMLPIIIRSADVVLRLVPGSLREASAAMGAPQWRTVWLVVLPTARSGLATSVILGVARGIGETAPVLLTSGFTASLNVDPTRNPMVSLPLAAFEFVRSPQPALVARGFATAAVLMVLVLVLFTIARVLGGRPSGTRRRGRRGRRRTTAGAAQAIAAAVLIVLAGLSSTTRPAAAESYQRISGEGSSWSAGFIDAMRVNVKQFGITVDYNPSGSSAGRKNWLNGTVDFAASDIPFQFSPEDGSAPENPAPGSYAYIPVTAGGTSFMYNLKINGQQVTNLRLSGENVAKVFTSAIKRWNDPAIQADNPGLTLPDRAIVPVVRSDGSGSSAQFTRWMIKQHPRLWQDYCERSGRAPACGFTSFYPTVSGMIAQSGDLGVAGYVAQNFAEGAIGYVNYSYAIGAQFPVVKVLNAAGYYTEPSPENVAVSLLKARINTDEGSPEYLTQILDDVYTDDDPRNYQLSSYSYFILPTKVQGQFTTAKGRTLGAFSYYSMCQGQQQSASLGYSPMPINLVEASFDQIRKVPGVVVQDIDIAKCKNPTFSPDGTNLLAASAAMPPACDRQGPSQCSTGTGGDKDQATPVKPAAAGGAAAAGAGGSAATGPTAAAAGGASGTAATKTSAASAGGSVATEANDPELAAEVGGTGGDEATTGGPAAAEAALATTTTLTGTSGWSGSQTLMVLIGLLLLALILAPAYLWRSLAGRRSQL